MRVTILRKYRYISERLMAMKRQWLILTVIMASFVGAIAGIFFSIRYLDQATPSYVSIAQRQALSLVSYPSDSGYSKNPMGIHFGAAAKLVTPAVVHIKTVYGGGKLSLNPLQDYLSPPARSSGSGVIVSDDGYIVTNNHVIEDASRIEVVMSNNQRFYAKLIGSDPSTDLALLKIKARSLPFVRYGDSDKVAPGEWVLAIGNPFDLNSTVTAGIVSAKARNIGILRDRNNLQVESFIQTDAAVNPGNSGGPLLDSSGRLIGVNTMIFTQSGSSGSKLASSRALSPASSRYETSAGVTRRVTPCSEISNGSAEASRPRTAAGSMLAKLATTSGCFFASNISRMRLSRAEMPVCICAIATSARAA